MKNVMVFGAGGFIGSHLVKRLKDYDYWVCGVDLKYPEFSSSPADEFYILDLRKQTSYEYLSKFDIDEIYQLAADMGGAGYIFTGEHDAEVMHNSALINLNAVEYCMMQNVKKIFFSSSACIYPEYNQIDPNNPKCSEESAYPAMPDSEYGWEKLFSERMYLSFLRNYGLDVKIARFHNIFGPEGVWCGGREKAPAAICRKVAMAEKNGKIEIWGDGEQTRSFLFIEDCLDGIMTLMESKEYGPFNIGSEEMITINNLVAMVSDIANKNIIIDHVEGPLGVRGRNSDNKLVAEKIGWSPKTSLYDGMLITYNWIEKQIVLQGK